MYNKGITSFLDAKKVNVHRGIKLFLEANGCGFTANDHLKCNYFISHNWERFASFIDTSIKSGAIKGKDVRLNYHFEEERKRRDIIEKEFATVDLSIDEIRLIKLGWWEWSPIHSLISKSGLALPKKDLSYTSRHLQNIPIVILLRENSMVEAALDAVENYNKKNKNADVA